MLSESRMIYGVKVWGLEGWWKRFDRIRGRFDVYKYEGCSHVQEIK